MLINSVVSRSVTAIDTDATVIVYVTLVIFHCCVQFNTQW